MTDTLEDRPAPAAPRSDGDPGPAVGDLETIVSLSKRRGFVFPSSEIYGGINAVWDYGPLGVELKNNVKRAWWRAMVQDRDDIVGLDAGILMHPQVWVTSGHVAAFSDPLVECQTCHQRFRVDELPGAESLSPAEAADPAVVERLGLRCPVDGGPLTPPRRFNLMLKTFLGPVEDEASVAYLRPETAQGIYVNFRNVQAASRKKLPFGIAQIGKAFRNEISPGNFVFRMREFEQMEMQYFVKAQEAADWFERWRPARRAWYERYGVDPRRLRFREHGPGELAHYAKRAVDIEYRFPFGWKELEGIHNRGDWDLGRHQEASGESLEYFDPTTNEHYVPWIVETSAGADRAAFTFLIDAYREEAVRGEKRVVLAFHPELAPYKVAVLPLLKKRPEIVELCRRIVRDLRVDLMAVYDDTASIGKLYRRQDEIGTPWCVTVDVESLDDRAVTVRDRDSMTQERVPVEGVKRAILDRLAAARASAGGDASGADGQAPSDGPFGG
ncbi:MAG TPA: glycine--tRNA ligase [Candidatus Limnocylindrales bacterium]|nr:glycine--tRNA ligase [Candidatus Limnocylindrales bacterium]